MGHSNMFSLPNDGKAGYPLVPAHFVLLWVLYVSSCLQNPQGRKWAPVSIFMYPSDVREHLATLSGALSPFYCPSGPREGVRACTLQPASGQFPLIPSALLVGLKEVSPSYTWSGWGNATVLPTKPITHYLYRFADSLCGLEMSHEIMK